MVQRANREEEDGTKEEIYEIFHFSPPDNGQFCFLRQSPHINPTHKRSAPGTVIFFMTRLGEAAYVTFARHLFTVHQKLHYPTRSKLKNETNARASLVRIAITFSFMGINLRPTLTMNFDWITCNFNKRFIIDFSPLPFLHCLCELVGKEDSGFVRR